MRALLLVMLIPALVACSTVRPAAVSEPSSTDLTGRWSGTWTGTGLLMAPREDAVTVDRVHRGDAGYGRLVLEGTGAAESVPEEVRYAGLWGIRVVAKISEGKVTLRHQEDGRFFTADLKVAPNGDQMYGTVRGSNPVVGLILTRGSEAQPTPPQAATATPPADSRPREQAIAMVPEQKPADTPVVARPEQFDAGQELSPIYFDFDKAVLRQDAVDTLTTHVGWLKEHSDAVVLVEGHCDERGTTEYNMALGERRANSVRDLLFAHGIAPERVATTSYGRERPTCVDGTDECRSKNRRAEFRIKQR